jgi:protein arginine N-methyltransferase 3
MADTTSRATARSDSDSGSEASDPLDLKNDEGWEDVEEDTEALSFVSLFDDKTFPHLQSMLEYMRTTYDFDLKKVHKELGLKHIHACYNEDLLRSTRA